MERLPPGHTGVDAAGAPGGSRPAAVTSVTRPAGPVRDGTRAAGPPRRRAAAGWAAAAGRPPHTASSV